MFHKLFCEFNLQMQSNPNWLIIFFATRNATYADEVFFHRYLNFNLMIAGLESSGMSFSLL